MTTEEKRLLLIDLSARLLYRVKVKVILPWVNDVEFASDIKIRTLNPDILNVVLDNDNQVIKPYLRPMSSMTEDEKQTHEMFFNEDRLLNTSIDVYIDWLNSYYFDYRGLIPMGLALPALEGMYN